MNGVELFVDQPLALQAQECEIVEAGVGWWLGDRIKLDVGVAGGDDLLRLSELEESVVVADLKAGEVEGVVAQVDPLAAQVGGHAVSIRFEGDGGRLGDRALGAVEESVPQLFGIGGAGGGGRILTEAFKRCLAGL